MQFMNYGNLYWYAGLFEDAKEIDKVLIYGLDGYW